MPTSRRVQSSLRKNLPLLNDDGPIYDLGSGWGSSTRMLAAAYPDHTIIGIENFPIPYFYCCFRQMFSRKKNVRYVWANFYNYHLNNASLVFCYLHPEAMPKLKTKFEKELKSNTVVISNTFGIPLWDSEITIKVEDIYNTPLYFYKI